MTEQKLRPYQKEDVQKLLKINACAILNEQRTGKTPTSLILSVKKNATKVIMVVPGSALYTWKKAYEDWTGKPCVIIQGTAKKRLKITNRLNII